MTEASRQLGLALGPFQNRPLFAINFLLHRLPEWPEFAPERHEALRARLRELWQRERDGLPGANEAQTEERLVKPVLAELGHAFTVQAGLRTASGRLVPDYALFSDEQTRREADGRRASDRFEAALAVADAKRFDRPLDRRERAGGLPDDPVAQITNYLLITRRPNKQFIAPLPVRIPDDPQPFDDLGRRLHETAVAIGRERQAFSTGWGMWSAPARRRCPAPPRSPPTTR